MNNKLLLLLSILFSCATQTNAQDLTGTWEGPMGNDQFLQVNIIQNGNKVCGYTYDYVIMNHNSFCKANFIASYNKKHKEWLFTGTSFIENPADFGNRHVLMKLTLSYEKYDDREVLVGFLGERQKFHFSISVGNGGIGIGAAPEPTVYQRINLVKKSNQPTRIYPGMEDCWDEKKKKDSLAVIAPVVKDTVIVKKDTAVLVENKPEQKIDEKKVNKDSVAITKEMSSRKNENITTLKVKTRSITIKVFDNGIVDGDTVSVFYNKTLLLSHQPLTTRPIVINIELKPEETEHAITLFAENLGSIPPNTALVIIVAGDQRYELKASADLKQNASVILQYAP